ncbi:hypothetical protein DID88_002232 [Monilinia fructigena]|uniref:deoxyhypusine synthase n=1 Tax=Monilinia fructigena TaxID=38457 RepID=A0A395ID41_9HELO|nr:hypothetical protein DID88_002232 [Monilinia fructigena]
MPVGAQKVEELDFNKFAGRPITVDDLLSGMNNMGFQASSIGEAVRIINDMRAWRDPESSDRQNRIGNLIVPNNNYCAFEDWVMPILDTMLSEQEESKKDPNTDNHIHWTPILPAQLRVDLVEDIRKINTLAVRAKRAGMIILGGGVVKTSHCQCMSYEKWSRECCVYINTAQEFDGSDAGARPDEAVSWGKIKVGADSVKVYVEATACFPLIVAGTFAKDQENSSSLAPKKVLDD